MFSSLTRTALRRRVTGSFVAAGATGMLVLAGTGSASAAPTVDWSAVAQCESGGDWNANTGNGFSGGLQFTQSTWAAYGGTKYAASAHQATPQQQAAVADKVLQGQGIGAWPVCGAKAGL
ncbi:transglycosylase family protein [Streptomyces enissocaesilis]|uniref:Resuscitation-promoting factor core lysozyme-like domain-containing protein n=1 Tax=Streptomyces enissocaesilis TaxID=332589 RepID=A0ABP6JYW6_9ACTN